MNLSQKIQDALHSRLIGAIHFSDDEMDSMLQIMREEYESAERRPSRQMHKIDVLLVLLVNLAKKWGEGNERRFWQAMWEKIFDDPDYKPSQGYFFKDLEKVIEKAHKRVFRSKNGRRFCDFILYHALAPYTSFEALVGLMWNAYLDEELFNADFRRDDPLVEKFVVWLRNKFSGCDDNLLDDGVEFEGKIYAIRAALKCGFMQNTTDEMKGFAQDIFSGIDRYYHREAITDTSPDYFTERCNESIHKLLFGQSSAEQQQRTRSSPEEILIDISKAYAGYAINNAGEPVLFVPETRMIEEEGEQVCFKVFANETLLKEQWRYIVGEGLKRRIKRIELSLLDLIPQLSQRINMRVELWIDDRMLFDSQDKLFRNFLLFSERREERGAMLRPGTYGFVCSDEILKTQQSDCEILIVNDGCKKVLVAQNGAWLSFSGRSVCFIDRNSTPVACRLEGNLVSHLTMCSDESKCPIYTKVPQCILRLSTEYPSTTIGIQMDDKFIGSLSSLSIEDVQGSGVWSLDLSRLVGVENGLHELCFSDLRTVPAKLIFTSQFYVSDRYHVEMEKTYCFDTYTSVIVYDGAHQHYVSIHAETGNGYLETGGGMLCVAPPCLRWRLDEEPWHMNCTHGIFWHRAPGFHNNVTIEIDAPTDVVIVPSLGNSQLKSSSLKKNRFLLGDAMQKSPLHMADVFIKIGDESHSLFALAFEPSLLALPQISLSEGTFYFDAQNVFVGESGAILELSFFDEDHRQCAQYRVPLHSIFTTALEDGYYTIKIDLLVETLFDVTRHTLGTFEDVLCGNPSILHFRDIQVHLDKTKYEKGTIRFSGVKIDKIRYLGEDIHPVYAGTLFSPGMKSQSVHFVDKGNTLRIYYPGEDEMVPANVDIQKKCFVNAKPDNHHIFACRSVYYKEGNAHV